MRLQRRAVSRRRFLAALPIAIATGVVGLACARNEGAGTASSGGQAAASTPTPTPVPIVLPRGRREQAMLSDTRYETPLYLFGSGLPGPVALILGGVHGNEPGGWLAAEQLVDTLEIERGSVLLVPRANELAIQVLERTLPDLGDLNRLYPGDPAGLPMARMAYEIVRLIERYRVDALIDMHESWAFYKDRPQSGTAFLGQTISTFPNDHGPALARAVVAKVNRTVLHPREEFSYRETPPRQFLSNRAFSAGSAAWLARGEYSSLGLGYRYPKLAAILVETGQQQLLERRSALHVQVAGEILRTLGMGVT